MDFFYYYYAAVLFVFGLMFGSFLNVCIYRLPRDLSVVSPRSACPVCKAPITWRDNIPVLSWLLLRGRCRHCATRITPRYAIVELTTAVLFLCSYVSVVSPPLTLYNGLACAKSCIFCFLVLGLIFTDFETFLLPDSMTLPGLVIGLVFGFLVPVNGIIERIYGGRAFHGMQVNIPLLRALSAGDAVLGALIGGGFIFLIGEVYFRVRGIEGMGFGDVKLMAMAGAFLGAERTALVLFAASIAGSLFGLSLVGLRYQRRLASFRSRGLLNAQRRARLSAARAMRFQEMPFGVFLGGASLLSLFFGDGIVRWYLRFLA
jgi:leader peptidase (prepilin peptidase)/N-methyltransferase